LKYYIIAGEASGDLHAANLVKELKAKDTAFEGKAWGGDLLKAEGLQLVKHYRELAFMGFAEVISNIRTIFKNIEFCKKDILAYKPDALILVDYPGFNMRIAAFAKKQGIKVIYYISPQVWAWKQSRVHALKRDVDRMLVILPFEKEFYHKFNYKVDFTGHPLLDAIKFDKAGNGQRWRQKNSLDDRKIIALLPGSRKQEITTMLPLMLSVQKDFTEYNFVIAGAPSVEAEFYKQHTAESETKIVYNQTYELLANSYAALVTSGTATLETALYNVPEVVCYKGSLISYHIARKLIKIKYISLVNLIMDDNIVTELIQENLNKETLKRELDRIINDQQIRTKMLEDYKLLREKLGGSGASAKAASIIINELQNT
jgi:lipid-A-disaccharide synthase